MNTKNFISLFLEKVLELILSAHLKAHTTKMDVKWKEFLALDIKL